MVIEWLNESSGAVQAIATVVLVAITWRYVWLTKRLVDVNQDQLEEAKRSFSERRTETLRAKLRCAEQMEAIVAVFPESEGAVPADRLRGVAVWTEEQEAQVLGAVAHTELTSAETLNTRLVALPWLRNLHERVRETSGRHGFRSGGIAQGDYARKLEAAKEGLAELIRQLRAAAGD